MEAAAGGQRGGPRRSRRSDALRNIDSILDAAARLLYERPRASMQDIADAAGVHRATVHRHFASRDDLLYALRERSLEKFIEVIQRQEVPDGGGGGEAIEQLTVAVLELGDRQRTWRILPIYDNLSEERQDEYVGKLMQLMRDAQRAGALRDDLAPELLVMAWGGLVVATLPRMAAGRVDAQTGATIVLRLLAPAR